MRSLVLGSHLPQTTVIGDGKVLVCKAQSWGTPPVIRVRTRIRSRNWVTTDVTRKEERGHRIPTDRDYKEQGILRNGTSDTFTERRAIE